MRKFPFTIDNSERNIFVRWPCAEMQKDGFVVARLLDNFVRRRLRLVDEVGIKYVELQKNMSGDKERQTANANLISLDDLRGWVVRAKKLSEIVTSQSQ